MFYLVFIYLSMTSKVKTTFIQTIRIKRDIDLNSLEGVLFDFAYWLSQKIEIPGILEKAYQAREYNLIMFCMSAILDIINVFVTNNFTTV